MQRDSPGWPRGLDDLGEGTPPRLWTRGAEGDAAPRWVAIVGTRAADRRALATARSVAMCAVDLGCGVISGGAMGVDAAAHEGALEAGGVTVAVLAGGVDRPSPARNRGLFEAVLERGGGLWSEASPGSSPRRGSFPRRNRLIAAAAVAVVVIQARQRSGSLSTAGHARRLGRPLGVVPGGWGDAGRTGCAELLRGGAAPLCAPEDLARLLGGRRVAGGGGGGLEGGPGGDAGRLLELLRGGVVGVERLAAETGWEVGRCFAALTELELGGWWNP